MLPTCTLHGSYSMLPPGATNEQVLRTMLWLPHAYVDVDKVGAAVIVVGTLLDVVETVEVVFVTELRTELELEDFVIDDEDDKCEDAKDVEFAARGANASIPSHTTKTRKTRKAGRNIMIA